ncbi:hypothetical protein BN77_p250007 [Rhizobium mesoamericanum STM3625]|uniref:Uncharacterized protein n=1 Tax=Rhizobium mesoamericanum STM3625 TaxID=1211777 RepID=K0Q1K0_9HYPH|nr:hypothetical protein BN77_p250007 [Rhizobium mesoamericanum STM3625]
MRQQRPRSRRRAHLTFQGAADGEIAFVALKGFLDVRYGARDRSAYVEFSWEGRDESEQACRRGWAALGSAGRFVGHFYIHSGDDSGFVCERERLLQQPAMSPKHGESDIPTLQDQHRRPTSSRAFCAPTIAPYL